MECYRKGLSVLQAEYALKKYKSYREYLIQYTLSITNFWAGLKKFVIDRVRYRKLCKSSRDKLYLKKNLK